MNELAIIDEAWYRELIDECKDILVEGEFAWRWTILETYHNLGARILKEHDNFKRSSIYGEQIVQRIAESLDRSERTIYYAMRFAEQFSTPNDLPEGKNVSWRLVCQKYLTKPKELPSQETEVKKATEEYILCKSCGGDNPLEMTCKRCKTDFEFEAKDIRRR